MGSPVLIVATVLLMFGVDAAPPLTSDALCGPMDVVFLLDGSKSVLGQDFEKQLQFAIDVVDRLDIGPGPDQTRVGVISIGFTYRLDFYLRTHKSKEDLKTAITQIQHPYSYVTNTGNSIRFMTRYMFRDFFGGRKGATRVAIVITDDLSQDPKSTRFEALLARKKGIKMFAIGVGLNKESELLSIGNQPTEHYVFNLDSFDSLSSVVSNLPRSSCEVATFTTQRPAPTKRFTFPPLNFNTFKFVPPKTRAPVTPSPSSVTSVSMTRTESESASKTSEPTATPQPKIAALIRNSFSSDSTRTQPSTSQEAHSSEATTNPPPTPVPTTTSASSTQTTNTPPTPAPTTIGASSSEATTNPPPTPAPTTSSTSSSETTNPSPTPAPTTSSASSSEATTNPPPTSAPTSSASSSEATTNLPPTPAPTTTSASSSEATTNPPTPAPTTSASSSEATTNPPTPEPTTSSASSSEATTNLPPTPAPTSASLSEATTNPPTPAPTTTSASSSEATTNLPPTPEPTPSSASSSNSARAFLPSKTVASSDQSQEIVSGATLLAEVEQAPEDLSLLNEPVEINNAPTKPVSETKIIDYVRFKKPFKKHLKKKHRKGNDVSNVITNNKYRWGPAPSNQMGERQHDAMMANDERIWSMMMGGNSAPFLSNKLSRDVAIADEPKQYCGGKNADVFFALDSSNSIWPEDFKKQIEFVTDLIDTFDFRNNKTRVGIIVYSTEIHMKVALQSGWTKEQIKRQINNTEYVSGLTNTSDAIRYIRTYGFTEANEREDTIKIAIILTDGISRDPLATKRESALSREEGIKLFAIGIGKHIQETELKRIANDPDDKYVFHVSSFGALASIRSIVAVSACGVVPDQPSNLIYCGADSLADVIFVYDAPGLGARKTRMLTSFVHDVTRGLQTAPDGLRIGRRSGNCPSNSNIDLTTDTNLRAFDNIQFPGIETLLGQLRMVFPNRLDAKNLAVVFVDESTQSIELATRVLKGDINFHVMVVAIGDPSLARLAGDLASLPHTDYLINIPSYMSLGAYRYEFLQKLCYLITNEPMYLRDARVRDMPGL